MKFLHFVAALLAIITLPVVATAQEEDFIQVEFITLSWKGNIKNLWFMSKEGHRKLDVYERDFTMPEIYTGPPIIRFYEDEAALDLPPEDRPEPSALAKLPASGGKILLMFAPKGSEENSWTVRVLDNSPATFPPGAYRVMNLGTSALRIALDRKVTPVKANSLAIVRPDRSDEVRDMPVQIAEGNKMVFSSIWGHQEDRRTTVFIIPDPNARNGIGVRRFYQAVIKEVE